MAENALNMDRYQAEPRLRNAHWAMIGLVMLACAVLSQGEHILAGGGLGWDGATYGAIVKDPASAIRDKYYLHRALPSWIVSAGLSLAGLTPTNERIVQGFLVLNVVLLIGVAALWWPIADSLRLRLEARWIGFIGLFGNFAMLKVPFYYPVITDVAAVFIGALMVLASLSGRRWLLGLAVLVSSFTWPLGTILALPLAAWPPGRMSPPGADRASLSTLAAVGAAGAFLAWFVWMYVVRGQVTRASHLAVPIVPGVVWIGIAGALAYIVASVRGMMAGVTVRYVVACLRRVDAIGIALVIAAALPASIIVRLMGEGQPMLTGTYFIGNVIFFSSTRPFLFALAHVVYFGPLLLLLLAPTVRREFVRSGRALGPGWILFLVATIGLSLNSESRHSVLQYVAVATLVAVAVDRVGFSRRIALALGALGLVLSKAWLTINIDPARMMDTADPLHAVHYRRYFMNHGPWMSNEGYVVNAIAVAVAAGVLWWALRGERSGPAVGTAGAPTSATLPGASQ